MSGRRDSTSPVPRWRHRGARRSALLTIAGLGALTFACTSRGSDRRVDASAPTDRTETASCDDTPTAAAHSPGVDDQLRNADAWSRPLGEAADRQLLSSEQIGALNASLSAVPDAWTDPRSAQLGDPEAVARTLQERETWLRSKVDDGDYVEGSPGSLQRARALADAAMPVDELRIVAKRAAVWCVPLRDGLYTPARDLAFDRNRCSSFDPGEVVRVLRRSSEDGPWHYVHGGHSAGWLYAPTWTPALDAERVAPFIQPRDPIVVVRDEPEVRMLDGHDPVALRMGTALPRVARTDLPHGEALASGEYAIRLPTAEGLATGIVSGDGVHDGYLPFTRRNVFDLAFSQLDRPYGWGGYEGGRDCSRYLHDIFATFGIRLPRNSAVQAQAGSTQIELAGLDEGTKLERIQHAAQDGVVLLYMRGHIMLYLGTVEGRPYALSSLSEFLEPCDRPTAKTRDRVFRLDRVEVTTLELGRDTARTSFIERLERAVVFGPPAAK